jgi:hypothetical protein
MGATARFRDAATAGSLDATTAIAPLRRLVSEPIAEPVAQQPDDVDRRRSLRRWHDRSAGRDLPLYRTPGFAQWHNHSLAHSEHLHGKPHRHAANECEPTVDAINIGVDRAGR